MSFQTALQTAFLTALGRSGELRSSPLAARGEEVPVCRDGDSWLRFQRRKSKLDRAVPVAFHSGFSLKCALHAADSCSGSISMMKKLRQSARSQAVSPLTRRSVLAEPGAMLARVTGHSVINLAELSAAIASDRRLSRQVREAAAREFGWPGLSVEEAIVLLGRDRLAGQLLRLTHTPGTLAYIPSPASR
jgi:hypothetical protein